MSFWVTCLRCTRLVPVLLVAAFSTKSAGQTPLQHQKRIYTSSEGKTFVQKSLPVYLRVSSSPDPRAPSHLLRSESTPEYSNPMYLDEEGKNLIKSSFAVDPETGDLVQPKQNIVFEIYADSRAPKTDLKITNESQFAHDSVTYARGTTELELTSTDEYAGVDLIFCSRNGAPFQKYEAPIILEKEGTHVLKYYSVDRVGNAEQVQVANIVIDAAGPSTDLSFKGIVHNNVLPANTWLILDANDSTGVKKTVYRIDSGPEINYKEPIKAESLSQGDHAITYYSVDELGNAERPRTREFSVDMSPPLVVEEVTRGSGYKSNGHTYTSGDAIMVLSATDNKAGVKEIHYSINGSDFAIYTRPVSLGLYNGKISIRTFAVDYVNNRTEGYQQAPASRFPYIDATGPEVTINFEGPKFKTRAKMFVNAETILELVADDGESGLNRIEYGLNDGEMRSYIEGFSIREEGTHRLRVTAYDNVENKTTKEYEIVVDNTGPEVLHQFTMPAQDTISGLQYPSHVGLFLSSQDEGCGYDQMQFSMNDSEPKSYANMIQGFEGFKDYNVRVWARDRLGNESTKSISFSTVD